MNNTTWDAPTRRTVAILLGVLFFYVAYLIRPVLPFLIIAGLIAFILAPIISFCHKRLHFPKGLAIGLIYLLFIIIVLLIPVIFLPAVFSAFNALQSQFDPTTLVRLVLDYQNWFIDILESYRYIEFLGIETDFSPIVDPAIETLKTITPSTFVPSLQSLIAFIPTTINFTWEIASNIFGTLISVTLALFLTILYSIYLSASAGNMIQGLYNRIPPAYQPELAKLGSRIQKVWSAYLRGQLTLALIIGFLTWAVGAMIGMQGAFALGVIAGAMEILPNIGPVLAAIPALLVALVQGSTIFTDMNHTTFFFIVLGVYILIQQIENNLIVPKILGDAVELSPLIVMIGVVVGFSVYGILGALIAAPVVATAREIVFYAYAKVLLQDPYPPEDEPLITKPSMVDRLTSFWQKSRQWLNPTLKRKLAERQKQPIQAEHANE